MTSIYKTDGAYIHNNKKLIRVTDWIKQFIPEFPAEMIAGKCGAKEGRTAEEILAKWKQKAHIATSLGTALHEAIDYYVKYGERAEHPSLQSAIDEFIEKTKGKKLFSEVVVYDDEVAGTIDLIESVKKGKVIIHDYKTNADLNKTNGKLLAPFEKLGNNPLNRYRLQLSKYKELLEKRGVEVVGIKLWHYTDHFEIINIEPLDLTTQNY